MYRELDSFRQALRKELESTLPPLVRVEPDKVIETYLDQLTLYVGADVADATLTVLALWAESHLAHRPGLAPRATWPVRSIGSRTSCARSLNVAPDQTKFAKKLNLKRKSH